MDMINASVRTVAVRAEYLSNGERYAAEEFTLEIADGLDSYTLALARANDSPYADARVPDLHIAITIDPVDPDDPDDPEPRPPSVVKPVCPKCGGDEICRDASATWSIDAQEWVLAGTYDCQTCGGCGAEGDDFVQWVPAGPRAFADRFFWAVVEALSTPSVAYDPSFQCFCLAHQGKLWAEDAAAAWLNRPVLP